MKRARGSAYPLDYYEKGEAETLEAVPRYEGSALGFRLVYDRAARTVRGGSFYYRQDDARAADREKLGPDNYCDTFGFRLVREAT
jgi:hypothetical protein